jgi:hypothetical protein
MRFSRLIITALAIQVALTVYQNVDSSTAQPKVVTTGGDMKVVAITQDTPESKFIKNARHAASFRRYLQERQQYYINNSFPQKHLDQASRSLNKLEDYLFDKGYTKQNGGEIKDPPKPVTMQIFDAIKRYLSGWVNVAYAYIFGKEDFESCGALPCTFDLDESYAPGAFALDATSKVNGADSIRCDIDGADGSCELRKNISDRTEVWAQFYILFPTGWTFGANGYLTIMAFQDSDEAFGQVMYLNVEDYGAVRIIADGECLAYTDTSLNISLNTLTRVEVRLKVSDTQGDVDIWVNNGTEGSPSYDGPGNLDTNCLTGGSVDYLSIGGYHPDAVNDKYYDDVIVDVSFIGTGAAATPATRRRRSSPIFVP